MKNKNTVQMIVILLLAAALLFAGCGGNNKVSKLTEIAQAFSGELDLQDTGLADLTPAELEKAWGEPVKKTEASSVWKQGDRYVELWFQDGKTGRGTVSSTLTAVVTEISGTSALICPAEGQPELRSGDRIFFSLDWLSAEDAAQVKTGTELKIEYDGMLMETSPMQIREPYAAWITGFRELDGGKPKAGEVPAGTEPAGNEPANGQDDAVRIVELIDHGAGADAVMEQFWQEGSYSYLFSSPHADRLEAVLSNGETIPFREAMDRGLDVVTALTEAGIHYYIERDTEASDPVDRLIRRAVLSSNGSGTDDMICLEDHQMLAKLGQPDGTVRWYVRYLYQEYRIDKNGDPKLFYENLSSLEASVKPAQEDGGEAVLTGVRDMTGENYEENVKSTFPEGWADAALGTDYGDHGRDLIARELAAQLQREPVWHDPDEEAFAAIRRGFALRLFQEAAAENRGENVLVAPLSVQLVLAMTANGADGATREELEDAVCGGKSVYELNEMFGRYMDSLRRNEYCQISAADAVWLRDDPSLTVKEDWLQRMGSFYGAKAGREPFDGSTVKKINDWVAEETQGMIPEIVKDLSPDDMMVLTNALSLDAPWSVRFGDAQPVAGGFTALDGTVQDAQRMYCREGDIYLTGENYSGFIKPYMGHELHFAVLMPDEDTDFNEFVSSLTEERLEQMLHPKAGEAEIRMPRFSGRTDTDLIPALQALGVSRLFESTGADLSAMASSAAGNLHVSSIRHSTFIEVAEEGTRAAAATSETVTVESLPPFEVTVDRPFVYMITDWDNVPLFMGAVTSLD